MGTPKRVQKWDTENRERTNARKTAYKNRQRARRDAVATATNTETDTK